MTDPEVVAVEQAVIAEALADLVVPISALKHHPENPKQGDVESIKASLVRFGQVRPIVVQKGTMYVCAGNHTLKAAIALGWQEIAAGVIDLSDEDALAYVLADNRTADLGGYDDVALMAALDKLGDGALGGTGFTAEDRQEMHDVMDDLEQVAIHPEELVAVDALKAHPANYQEHPEEQVEHLVASLREHGFYRKVVLANDGTILAGHGIAKAAAAIGLKKIPAVRLPIEPDSAEAAKIMAGDNELGKLAERDDRELTEMLRAVKESGDVGALLGTGYDAQTLANLVFVTRPESEVRNFDAAAEWVGLPEFTPAGDRITLVISFDTEEKRNELIDSLGLIIAKKRKLTWSCWWPPRQREDLASLYYGPDGTPQETAPVIVHVGDNATTNERGYHHPGCAQWIVPLEDGEALPEELACPECARTLAVTNEAPETVPPADPPEETPSEAPPEETTDGAMGGAGTADAAPDQAAPDLRDQPEPGDVKDPAAVMAE